MSEPVFLHSMWRTGSSYLQSRFDANPRYLTFYEPYNAEIGSKRHRERAAANYEEQRRTLRHPPVEGGYFAIYDAIDPLTRRPLWSFSTPRLTLYDVYNGLSDDGIALLAACIRVARARDRTPVFGFCHSGVQIAAMQETFGGTHLYLARDRHDQFASYAPRDNDFFMAATIMQVLASARLRPHARGIVPTLARLPLVALIKRTPNPLTMRLARQLWRRTPLPQLYQLFYLTWTLSHRAAESCSETLSLQVLSGNPPAQDRLAAQFGIDFEGLSYRASPVPDLDFAALEARAGIEPACKDLQSSA